MYQVLIAATFAAALGAGLIAGIFFVFLMGTLKYCNQSIARG